MNLKILIAVIILLLRTNSAGRAVDKLQVSNCFIGGAILPLWLARDAGLFQRERLDVESIWIRGNPSVIALISGRTIYAIAFPTTTWPMR